MGTTQLITCIATLAIGVPLAGFMAPPCVRERWGVRGLVLWWTGAIVPAAFGTGVALLAFYPFRWLMVFIIHTIYGESPVYGLVFGGIMGGTLGLMATGLTSWGVASCLQDPQKPPISRARGSQ